MLNVIFTLDYEIHGNGDGDPLLLMVKPTQRLIKLFADYGAKLTIMADIAEILKFKEYKEKTGRDDFYYEAIVEQLREAVRLGHDVQLHIHASFFNARLEGRRWVQDWSEYDFAGLGLDRMREIVRVGKQFLENILQPVNAQYKCFVFRAANWSVSPSKNVVRALVDNEIKIDTSVFKYGRRHGIVNFDYRQAPSALVPWQVDEDDVCRSSKSGLLFEFPIYAENRFLGAFVTPQRLFRAFAGRLHKVADSYEERRPGQVGPASGTQRASLRSKGVLGRHSWKADFNQCSGRQLIGALKRAEANYGTLGIALPFVLIGHSKLFTRFNEWSLRPFLSYVASRPNRFGFAIFADCATSFPKAVPRPAQDTCFASAAPREPWESPSGTGEAGSVLSLPAGTPGAYKSKPFRVWK